ncbi:dihydrolipoyl dehydrogenase family protein [Nocardia donostiensis]|uniref:Pyridine nucleotide-disulfide oxidoreductase n=1 Tax=Nocardia donostiensis TaxID=1538463 RepID=A0A1V2TFS3_9NOCA|nr:NAD(P)/FAD-dependent oxidoreductase [Nocardia donostiensis]ONM48372.1 pyridine nucleotide-disulfide oxidoreductase [Nocardia donostiensis]OQS12634.1 pyridine nucleotide-disulfide oxidoreductase [Nocardia donostiensis]OQS20518.1 pyridine nucleotide-disulfide oxidoreductase [Nocardia donostiensis]
MPSDKSAGEYDVIVLGGGPAGENAAAYAVAGSARTAVLVEPERLGGECSYWACIPSKALLRPGEVLAGARAMPGIDPGGLGVAAVLARRDAFIHGRDHDDSGQVQWAADNGIDVVRGAGRLIGPRQVGVDGRTLTARHAVVLATGSRPNIPEVPGLGAALPWTSRDATNMAEVPGRVVLVGGGVVACEAATWLSSLGAQVTMLVRGNALLAAAEPFAGKRVADALTERGVVIRFGAEPARVARRGAADTGEGRIHGGPVTVTVHTADGATELEADELVIAAGRAPDTEELGLESVGLPSGHLDVDDHLAVRGVDGNWLYAVGDINHRAALTHMGKYQARVCGDVIAARADDRPLAGPRFTATADHRQTPQVVYSTPEVASVGLTEAAARRAGYPVEVVETDIAVAGSSLIRDDYSGHAKLVIDTGTDTLLGATFVGPDVGEQLHAATIAVVGQVPLERLWHAVPAFPAVSEFWLRLLEARRAGYHR